VIGYFEHDINPAIALIDRSVELVWDVSCQ
jgi:hypothetical protein